MFILQGLYHLTLDGRCYVLGEIQDIELEMFTGFLDVNKNEIYENDVIRFDSFYRGDYLIEGGKGLVRWNNDSLSIFKDNDYYICGLWRAVHNYNAEVIGNKNEGVFKNQKLKFKPRLRMIHDLSKKLNSGSYCEFTTNWINDFIKNKMNDSFCLQLYIPEVKNILNIMKEGKDKEIFRELLEIME